MYFRHLTWRNRLKINRNCACIGSMPGKISNAWIHTHYKSSTRHQNAYVCEHRRLFACSFFHKQRIDIIYRISIKFTAVIFRIHQQNLSSTHTRTRVNSSVAVVFSFFTQYVAHHSIVCSCFACTKVQMWTTHDLIRMKCHFGYVLKEWKEPLLLIYIMVGEEFEVNEIEDIHSMLSHRQCYVKWFSA